LSFMVAEPPTCSITTTNDRPNTIPPLEYLQWVL
jgi:hypothetical protein